MSAFKDIEINNHIENIVKAEDLKTFHPSASLLDHARIPVKEFYLIDRFESTTGKGNMTVEALIGPSSPARYTKIQNFVMYGFIEELRKRNRDDVTGFKFIKRGTSYILGGVFEPIENSFFRVTIDNEDYLWQITSVEPIIDRDKPIYRVTHKPYVSSSNELYDYIDNQVVKNLTYIPENVGTEYSPLVETEVYDKLVKRAAVIRALQTKYIKSFYDEELNTFVAKVKGDSETLYYSPLVVEFLKKTQSLHHEALSVNMYISHETFIDDNFIYEFEDSIYGAILEGETMDKFKGLFSKIPYSKGSNMFSTFEKTDKTIYEIGKVESVLETYKPSEPDLFVVSIDATDIYSEIADHSWDVTAIEDIYDRLLKHRLYSYDLRAYLYTPIIINILLQINESNISKRYNEFFGNILGII